MIASRFSRLSLVRPLAVTTLIIYFIMSLIVAFNAIQASVYKSELAVFEEFLGGSIRLLFPLIVTLVTSVGIIAQTSNNFVQFTRTRVSIVTYLGQWYFRRAAVCFGLFFVFGLVCFVSAFYVVPSLSSSVIDPQAYGLTPAAASAEGAAQNPLGFLLLDNNIWLFGFWAAFWLGMHAMVFSAIATTAAVVIDRWVLALLAPFLLYLLQSVLLQMLGMPEFSFLVSAATPSSLQRFTLTQGVAPGLVLAVLALIGIGAVLTNTHRISSLR